MDHNSCSSSCSSCTSGSYSSYTSVSSDATSYDETPLALFQQLEDEIGTNIHLGVDLAKFAHEVWGLDKESVDKVLAMPIALEEAEVATYREGTQDDDLHKSFLAISGKLLNEASKSLGDEAGTFTDTFWNRLRQNPTSRSRRSVPDVVNTWKPPPTDGAAPHLSVAKGFCELKRIPREREIEDDDDEVEARKEEAEAGHDGVKSGVKQDEENPHEASPIAESKANVDCQRSRESQASKVPNSMLKRSFDSVKGADDAEGNTAKKQRCDDKKALNNSLLPLYATEAMASSSRHYVVGLVIDRFTVTVCYFDRFLVTCVASFSFEEEPSKLALALYAMNRCDRLRAGFDPHLRAPTDDEKVEQVLPVEDVVGSLFEYPASNPSSNSACFRVNEVIRRPDELIGRATAVYKVQRRLPDGTFSEEEFVYKLSWPSKSRLSEIEVVEALKDRLPKEAHDHLPDFTFTRTFTAEDLKLPWLRLGLDLTADNHKDRVLRGMVGKFYHKLWEAGSIENFKQAWLDCVECLYLARKLGKVQHRDLSENNLMVLKCPDGKVKGVLNDWDMAKFTDKDEDDLHGDEPRTGTLPFMAFDLVVPEPSPHWFRHDLESLFWILIWAALHYNLSDGTRDDTPHPAVEELTGSTSTNWKFKNAVFLLNCPSAREIQDGVKPEFAGVFEQWIEPLRSLFVDARMMCYELTRQGKECHLATYHGMVTFKTFMATINVTPRTWGIPNFLDDADDF